GGQTRGMPASAATAPAHQQAQRAHLSEDGCVTGKGVRGSRVVPLVCGRARFQRLYRLIDNVHSLMEPRIAQAYASARGMREMQCARIEDAIAERVVDAGQEVPLGIGHNRGHDGPSQLSLPLLPQGPGLRKVTLTAIERIGVDAQFTWE